jgi:hypothetical protein
VAGLGHQPAELAGDLSVATRDDDAHAYSCSMWSVGPPVARRRGDSTVATGG